MPATYHRPPKIGDERTQLLGWYDLQRGMVRKSARDSPMMTPIA